MFRLSSFGGAQIICGEHIGCSIAWTFMRTIVLMAIGPWVFDHTFMEILLNRCRRRRLRIRMSTKFLWNENENQILKSKSKLDCRWHLLVTYIEWYEIPSLLELIHLIWSMAMSIVESLLVHGTAEIGRPKLAVAVMLWWAKVLVMIPSEILVAKIRLSVVRPILEILSIASIIVVAVCLIKCDEIGRFAGILWATHCCTLARSGLFPNLFVCLFVYTLNYADDKSQLIQSTVKQNNKIYHRVNRCVVRTLFNRCQHRCRFMVR